MTRTQELAAMSLLYPRAVSADTVNARWKDIVRAHDLADDYRDELAACLPPRLESALRRGSVAIQFVREEPPVAEPPQDRMEPVRRAVRWCLYGLIVIGFLAYLTGCSPQRPTMAGSVRPTLEALDRIESGIVTHELTLREWRGARGTR